MAYEAAYEEVEHLLESQSNAIPRGWKVCVHIRVRGSASPNPHRSPIAITLVCLPMGDG